MLINIIHFFTGYVKLEIKGIFIERFLNMCTRLKIIIWDFKKLDDGAVCKITIKDYYKIKKETSKIGITIIKSKKCGLPYIFYKYRNRYGIAAGFVLFFGILYFLSGFIWSIDVTGNTDISRDEILNVLKVNGFEEGIYKKDLNLYDIKRGVLLSDKRISMININIKGSVAEIEIKQSNLKPEIIDKSKICDIVAMRDGYILDIAALDGTPLVKKGDSVSAGQKLISGAIRGKNSLRFVHSNGEVTAETLREHTIKIPKKYEFKQKTGKTKNKYTVKLINAKIKLYLDRFSPFEKYELETNENKLTLPNKLELPFSFIKNTYFEINTEFRNNSETEADKKAEINKKNYENQYLIDTKIINCDIIKNEDDNNYIYTYLYTLHEKIGIVKETSPEDIEAEKARPTSEFQEVQ